MSFTQKLLGFISGNGAEVNSDGDLQVALPTANAKMAKMRFFSENDPGDVTGEPYVYSPETDDDFRLRTAQDLLLDTETFNYTTQNSKRHVYRNTTMAMGWTAAGLQSNASSITTTTTGASVQSTGFFSLVGISNLYFECRMAFSALPVANTVIDFGGFLPNTANPYNPTDGAYFRLDAAGIKAVINSNGTVTENVLHFTYSVNQKYTFIVSVNQKEVKFWIDDVLYFSVGTPVGENQPFMSSAVPFAFRHAIVGGAAGGVLQATLSYYNVSVAGIVAADNLSSQGNRFFGSYQSLSGSAMASLANYANSANPTAAVPTNTTAALGSGLGGQFWETDTLAVNTDGILQSYQVPAATVNVAGRTLVIRGVTVDSYVQTALTGGGYVAQFSLAFGHTAVSLATTDAATTKAPVRVPLGIQSVASGAAALTLCGRVQQEFDSPIYVNPGEFVAIAKKKIGTAPSAGVIGHLVTFDYGWV